MSVVPPEPGAFKSKNAPTTQSFVVSAPRVYCILSRFPVFHLHFDILYSLIGTNHLLTFFVPTFSHFQSHAHTARERMRRDCARSGARPPTGSDISELLAAYAASKLPTPGGTTTLILPGETQALKCYIPVRP